MISNSGSSKTKAIKGIISVPKQMRRIKKLVMGGGYWIMMKIRKG
jgi:hypothetical protein